MIDLTKKSTDELREELIAALKAHDWYYDRSDDLRRYESGRETLGRIVRLIPLVPDSLALYNKHTPWGKP